MCIIIIILNILVLVLLIIIRLFLSTYNYVSVLFVLCCITPFFSYTEQSAHCKSPPWTLPPKRLEIKPVSIYEYPQGLHLQESVALYYASTVTEDKLVPAPLA